MIDILLKYQEAILVERANVIKAQQMLETIQQTVLPALRSSLRSCLIANAPTQAQPSAPAKGPSQ